jgi:hypothetical protein
VVRTLERHPRDAGVARPAATSGCGNSQLPADLHDAGVSRVTSVDFSEKVIQQMRTRNEARSGRMQWDVTAMGVGHWVCRSTLCLTRCAPRTAAPCAGLHAVWYTTVWVAAVAAAAASRLALQRMCTHGVSNA